MTEPGAVLAGRYRLHGLLGTGARKRVVLATDTRLDRLVAVCTPQRRDAGSADALRREAALTASVGHSPHVVAVHDVGEADGTPYLVLQHLPGGSVAELLGPGLPLARALALARDVAAALADLHAAGVVHRDVTPANVWLTADHRAVVGDLGLALPAGAPAEPLTGTPAYAPPEQAAGGPADPRSDLFALGALLWSLLTGRPPSRDVEDALDPHRVPPRLSAVRPDLPPDVDALAAALLNPDPDRRPGSAAEVLARLDRALDAARPAAVLPAAAPFVGRDEELAALHQALAAAGQGHGGLVLLLGEAGIGKTRTCDELAAACAATGGLVLQGRCHDADGDPAYWPWTRVLGDLADAVGPDRVRAEAGPDAALLAAVLPALADGDAPALPAGEGVRLRLFDAVRRLLHRLALDRPLLVVLDDLHDADLPTLALLRYVARETSRSRVLLLGAARELDVADPARAAALARLARSAGGVVPLSGLPEDQAGRLVEHLTGSRPAADLLQSLHAQTDGNPFFLTEVVRLLAVDARAGVPSGVREVLHRRLERLRPATVEALRTAAVVGREVPVDVLAEVLQVPPEQVLGQVDEAVGARLLQPVPGRPGLLRFAHALVREVLHDDLPLLRRVRLHRQVAEALLVLRPDDLDAHAAELATHLVQAAVQGDPVPAVLWSVRAAAQATARAGHEEAVAHLERALALHETAVPPSPALPARGALLLALGDARVRAGSPTEGKAAFSAAAALALEQDDPELLARAALGLGLGPGGFGFAEHADGELLSLLEEALAGLPDDSPLRVRVLARLATELYFTPFVSRRLRVAQEAVDVARRLGDAPGELVALYSRTWARLGPDDVEPRRAAAVHVVELAAELGDAQMLFRGHHLRLHALLELGERAAADAAVEQLRALAETQREPVVRWQVAVHDAARALRDGRVAEGEQRAAQALELGRHGHADMAMVVYGAQLLCVRWAQGRLAEVVEAARSFADRYPHAPAWRAALAFCLLSCDEREAAQTELDRLAGRGFADLPRDGNLLTVTTLLAHVAAGLGDLPRARDLRALLAPYADRSVTIAAGAVTFTSVELPLAALATALGEPDVALAHLDRSRARHADAPAWRVWDVQEQVRALLARGRPGDLEAARRAAADGARLAEALGLSAHAQGLRHAVPGGPVTLLLTDVAGSTALTERLGEVEVHALLAAHRQGAAALASARGGRSLKSLGDGVLLAFADPLAALDCAVALQQDAVGGGLPLRLAVHVGPVLHEGASMYGRTMVVAFRLGDRARAGEVLVSGELRDAVPDDAGLRFDPPRRLRLKGLDGTQRVHRLLWRPGPERQPRPSASTASNALRAAISTGSHTGENGGA